MPGEVVPFESSESLSSRRSGISYRWTKAGISRQIDDSAVWTLALDLVTSANRRRGALKVHRLYSARALQLDINLLTGGFPGALADALDRTLAHSAHVIALPDQDTPLIAAQAG